MDLMGYDAYFSGKLEDYALPQSELDASIQKIAGLPKP